MIQTQPLGIDDFTGGITDHIYRADTTKAQVIDNFIMLSNKSIDLRPGSVVDDLVNGLIPAGNQRIGTLINYDNSTTLFVQSAKKLYYRNPSAYSTLQGPTGNDLFSSGSTTSIVSFSQWNKHIFLTHDGFPRPQKIYKDGGGVYQLRTSGLPALATPPSAVGTAGVNNYVYAFHYKYTYTVGSQTFIDAGPVFELEVPNINQPSVSTVFITAIPVISNGLTDNWDTTVITVEIFRTINNGAPPIFYKVGMVTNGTTTFNDTFSDVSIQNNELIYIADGSVDNDPPPLSKFIHIVNSIAIYGYLKEGSEERPFTYRQSVPLDLDSVPTAFEDTVEDEIAGVNSVKSVPIILCKRKIYRVEGQFDQFGRGFMSHITIHDTAGCISNQSCVQAENGLFWAGNNGFYTTDGYQCFKISDDNNMNYKSMVESLTDKKHIVGRFDELNRRIIWTTQTDSGSLDNDSCYVLDLRQGVRPDSTFYNWRGGDSFAPSAIEFFNGDLYRADKRGYVFIHNEDYLTDPKVDTGEVVADWVNQTIIWRWKSIAFNGGSNFLRKIATRILLTAKNKTNVSIQINAINDDGKIERSLKEIRWRKNFVWGDPEFVWGDASCVWDGEGLIEQWRRFPAKGLRWSYLQIEITNSYTIVTNSDTLGTATFGAVANTAFLDDFVNADWPKDSVDYFISTEADNYDRQFQVVSMSPDTLTLLDPQNVLPNGSLKWLLKGYKKSEALNLLALTLHWAALSKSQETFETGDSGANT